MVLNKSNDLIDNKVNVVFRKFQTEAIKVDELKLKWSEKMAKSQEKRFTKKDIVNLKLENQKLKDLEFLRNQIPPDPIAKPEDVSMDDLRNVLNRLQGISTIGRVPVARRNIVNAEVIKNMSKTEIDAFDKCFKYGEHIAVYGPKIMMTLNLALRCC